GRAARMLASWYSLRAGFAHHSVDKAGTPDCMESVARALRASGLSSVEIYPLATAIEDSVAIFRRAGWIARAEQANVSWQVATEGEDFAAYWAKRPSRLRNTAQRKAKAAGLDIFIHRRFDEAAWADYESIYEASWKPEEGSPAFLRALAEQEGAAGTLRLGIASKDGKPLAAQLWLIENGEAFIHKLAYREDSKDLSPGTVLSMAMFRSALDEDRVGRIDYGTGDDGYKRDWMEERVPLSRLTAWNPATIRGLAGAARAAGSALVARLRSR
ncbi:MAG: GNAT family N-acetyltransferase, partial [Allosphingosinicella sp.]